MVSSRGQYSGECASGPLVAATAPWARTLSTPNSLTPQLSHPDRHDGTVGGAQVVSQATMRMKRELLVDPRQRMAMLIEGMARGGRKVGGWGGGGHAGGGGRGGWASSRGYGQIHDVTTE